MPAWWTLLSLLSHNIMNDKTDYEFHSGTFGKFHQIFQNPFAFRGWPCSSFWDYPGTECTLCVISTSFIGIVLKTEVRLSQRTAGSPWLHPTLSLRWCWCASDSQASNKIVSLFVWNPKNIFLSILRSRMVYNCFMYVEFSSFRMKQPARWQRDGSLCHHQQVPRLPPQPLMVFVCLVQNPIGPWSKYSPGRVTMCPALCCMAQPFDPLSCIPHIGMMSHILIGTIIAEHTASIILFHHGHLFSLYKLTVFEE